MEHIPICRPTLPDFEDLKDKFSEVFKTGMLTNGKYVKEFEEKCREYLGVGNAVAVANCTSGLMLALKALDLKGEVIVPSFTFTATVHSLLWNGLKPVFVDCDPNTFNLDVNQIESKVSSNTSAILAVYIFGNPPEISKLEEIADKRNLKLIFDSAHAFGSKYHGKLAGGFGNAEVFSLTPTKLLVAGEGGLITTNDDELARKLRIGRDYGNPGDYNCEFVGLNARLTEFNAILGIRNLKDIEQNVLNRNRLVDVYRSHLETLPGITFQKIEPGMRCTYKDFSILIDPCNFGVNRDTVALCLEKEGISTKKYYYPPVHKQDACRSVCGEIEGELPETDFLSDNILSLPIYSHMSEKEAMKICKAVKKIYNDREKILKSLNVKSYEEVKI